MGNAEVIEAVKIYFVDFYLIDKLTAAETLFCTKL